MSVALDMVQGGSSSESEDLKTSYLKSLKMIELLHRLLLDVIKDEFERLGRSDINSVQALLLFNIGDAELTAGELRSRGYYLGSNVSYNLKKLVDLGFIRHERSDRDRRSVRVSLTEAGLEVCRIVDGLYDRQLLSVEKVGGLDKESLDQLTSSLFLLERFWADQIRFRL